MPVDIGVRVKPYGLTTAQLQPMLTNLTVAPGQQMRITQKDPAHAPHVKQLNPTTVSDLRATIGVPEKPAAAPGPHVPAAPKAPVAAVTSGLPAQLTGLQHVSLWNSAHNAVYGQLSSINPSELTTVNKWLVSINPNILIFLYQDITVETNATLILAPDVSVLFANNILINQGGRILCQGGRVKFDCASLRGFDGPPSPGTGT
jgi:hypothetical protein